MRRCLQTPILTNVDTLNTLLLINFPVRMITLILRRKESDNVCRTESRSADTGAFYMGDISLFINI